MRKVLWIGLISLLAAAIAGEVFCRLTGRDGRPDFSPHLLAMLAQRPEHGLMVASSSPRLLYEPRPDYHRGGERWTERGGIVRATDVPLAKLEGTVRIAVVGDSISAALKMRDRTGELPFPDRLEHLLRESGRTVEVLNFGVDGYGTLQEAALFKEKVARYGPDVLVLQYCLNDPGLSYVPAVWFLAEERPVSYLWSFLSSRLSPEKVGQLNPRHGTYVPSFGPVKPDLVEVWTRLYDPESAPWQRVEQGFAEIRETAAALDCPVVVLTFPLFLPPEAAPELVAGFRRQVHDAARRNGFDVVDMTETFGHHPMPSLQDGPSFDPYHPSALGHQLAAEALARRLREVGLLD